MKEDEVEEFLVKHHAKQVGLADTAVKRGDRQRARERAEYLYGLLQAHKGE